MKKTSRPEIPRKAIYRLSIYLRCLSRLKSNGIRTVSSEALAKAAGVKSTQLRKDLTYFGQFGTRGLGYDVEQLSTMISDLLGTNSLQPVILVGVGNTAFSYGAYAVLLSLGLEFRVASMLALILGIAFSFTTQGNVVFRNATRITFIKFVVAWMVIYAFNIAVIVLLMRVSFNAYTAGAIATVPVTVFSYFILRFVVFGRQASAHPAKSAA